MKKKSLVSKSIIRLMYLGLVILISISVVSGIQFYNTLESEYKDSGSSFLQLLSSEIDTGYIKEVNSAADKPAMINNTWYNTNSFLQRCVELDKKYITINVLIPDEEKGQALYIWSESNDDSRKNQPMTNANLPKEELLKMGAITLNLNDNNNDFSDDLILQLKDEKLTGFLIKPLFDENNNIIAFMELELDLSEIQKSILKLILFIAIFIIAILALALEIYFYFIKREVMQPIIQLEDATSNVVDKLKSDSVIEPLNIKTNDEIEALSHSFEAMEENLRNYIIENREIVSEQEKIRTELNLAANIQADMLIKYFPPFPERKDFNIFASMTPAKEVGGDFYDFFLVDHDHLALVIADVSGKGVPASLFMMRSMLMIESLTTLTRSPSEILETLNKMICDNNESKMFVTVWLAILDLKSGKLTAANAGHEYPIIKTPGKGFELYKDKHCFIVGGKKKAKYKDYEITLEPGSVIFVYTDGVPEAKNAEGKMFKLDATVDALNSNPNDDVETLTNNVKNSVSDFVKDAEQFDDLTMLCVEYLGQEGK
ncbi:MAG: HAMP domain-containing protein [Lachnospiraceae bacterium]|nr:HAMP domain-containing protein [Lachnospiraceae bacterium]